MNVFGKSWTWGLFQFVLHCKKLVNQAKLSSFSPLKDLGLGPYVNVCFAVCLIMSMSDSSPNHNIQGEANSWRGMDEGKIFNESLPWISKCEIGHGITYCYSLK